MNFEIKIPTLSVLRMKLSNLDILSYKETVFFFKYNKSTNKCLQSSAEEHLYRSCKGYLKGNVQPSCEHFLNWLVSAQN